MTTGGDPRSYRSLILKSDRARPIQYKGNERTSVGVRKIRPRNRDVTKELDRRHRSYVQNKS